MRHETVMADPFASFRTALEDGGHAGIRAGIIGRGVQVPGPFGPKPMIYADYVASGRALEQVERFIYSEVLPYYANTHTEASFAGAYTTKLREAARQAIARSTNAGKDCAVVFAGSGATAGINRLVGLFGVREALEAGRDVVVLRGPYEHHSNILPWDESGAQVIEIPEGETGGPCPSALSAKLRNSPDGALVIGAFSAASNVSGIMTDVPAVTRILKAHGALAVWDYAGAGPYLPIDMAPAEDSQIDAVLVSPHKFVGGPGASGIMIVRRSAVATDRPVLPGGGTITYVGPNTKLYSDRIEDREEAGTPNIVGDIRAGLSFIVKDVIGQSFLSARQKELADRGLKILTATPGVQVLGNTSAPRLPIFSVVFTDTRGQALHYNYVTRLLSDLHGIQVRGGCACAGPYTHRLMKVSAEREAEIREEIKANRTINRPGFVRFNLSALTEEAEISEILGAVTQVPSTAGAYRNDYRAHASTGQYEPVADHLETRSILASRRDTVAGRSVWTTFVKLFNARFARRS